METFDYYEMGFNDARNGLTIPVFCAGFPAIFEYEYMEGWIDGQQYNPIHEVA